MKDYPFATFRLELAPKTLIGPGKANLLAGIAERGSIAAAGRRMGMSYKRAWYLIDTLNHYFREPLVVSSKGGKAGGGAALTETGKAVLELYRRAESAAAAAMAEDLKALAALASPKD